MPRVNAKTIKPYNNPLASNGETPKLPDIISAGFISGMPIIGAISISTVITAVATKPASMERPSLFVIIKGLFQMISRCYSET